MKSKTMIRVWPVSKYVGKYPKGTWHFIGYFKGTEEETLAVMKNFQLHDKDKAEYRIYDCNIIGDVARDCV